MSYFMLISGPLCLYASMVLLLQGQHCREKTELIRSNHWWQVELSDQTEAKGDVLTGGLQYADLGTSQVNMKKWL